MIDNIFNVSALRVSYLHAGDLNIIKPDAFQIPIAAIKQTAAAAQSLSPQNSQTIDSVLQVSLLSTFGFDGGFDICFNLLSHFTDPRIDSGSSWNSRESNDGSKGAE